MTAEEALTNAFQGIADAFLDMAMQMIQEWIKMQLIGLVGSVFGGAAGGAGGMGGFGATPLTSGMSFFAEGGRPPLGEVSLVGEKGRNCLSQINLVRSCLTSSLVQLCRPTLLPTKRLHNPCRQCQQSTTAGLSLNSTARITSPVAKLTVSSMPVLDKVNSGR